MVTCMNKERKYGSVISNGKVSVDCDNPTEYGGDGYVFGPHDFIEAGYAACLDVCARKICEADGIEFKKVIVTVALDYHDDKKTYIRLVLATNPDVCLRTFPYFSQLKHTPEPALFFTCC